MFSSRLILLSFLLFVSLGFVSSNKTYCPNATETNNSEYRSNVNMLLSTLTTAASRNNRYFNASVGSATSTVHGLYMCHGNTSMSTCRSCVGTASSNITHNCPRGMQAVIWYDDCMIRYSNVSFIGKVDLQYHVVEFTANPLNITYSADYQKQVNKVVATAVSTAASEAAFGNSVGENKYFATKEAYYNDILSVYVLAQCTQDLSADDCYSCLVNCNQIIPTCCESKVARVMFFSCYLSYEVRTFQQAYAPGPAFGPSAGPYSDPIVKRDRSMRNIPKIIAISASLVILLILSSLWFCIYKKKTKQASEENINDIIEAESLLMEFNVIRAATQNFAIDRKLGQGGFGQVYKGTLESGEDIAVKRLSKTSGQGIVEFKTEVVLVAKLQHRNLVRLLGFCISGKERLLVYELLPNSSLDKILFDPTKRMSLNWETRFKIISGIAKGLLYLHEDSRLKIVHRDLKSSNILLDEDMNPKISDFGLAKLFGIDQTQDATNTIVGTYGYMAPEYIFTGRYSVKSDAYSFGIMVLEVISGQRNYMSRPNHDEALIQRAWRLWSEGASMNLVDEALGNIYSEEQVLKSIHIGLLCIQENAARRPNMALVLATLGGQAVTLPLPSPPSFFDTTDSTLPGNAGESAVMFGQNASVDKHSDITELYPR